MAKCSFTVYLVLAALIMAFAAADRDKDNRNGPRDNFHRNGPREDFYRGRCNRAESIVFNNVKAAFERDPGVAPGLIRMHFHDCFVRGCDGSVLIDSTPDNKAEKDSPANNPSLRGFEVIDAAKAELEAVCPETVSCADILAFAARDSAFLTSPFGRARWQVKGGRKDGKISLASDTTADNLPSPAATVDQLTKVFVDKGLSQQDMVILSGAHTIGVSHCNFFVLQRLYNFNSTHSTDPSLDPSYAAELKEKCPANTTDNNITVRLDSSTLEDILDNNYYDEVTKNRGLFVSDATLLTDPNTYQVVQQCAASNMFFWGKFSDAMARLADVGVLTGEDGEIRLNCRKINN
ncbi:hypothetical protein SUGI_0813100 [Cryptomeria japonica]|nr:hypothetical protein SUGI_0813100 [Cryptomeria japonica]